MSKQRDVLDDLLRLPAAERARLARQLLLSLEDDGDLLDEKAAASSWMPEIERRAREVLDGKIETLAWTEVRDSARRKLKARRARVKKR